MKFRTPIKTSRLVLQKESKKDFERFFTMSKDPQVMKYIGNGNIFYWKKDVAFEKFNQRISLQVENETGNLAVYRKDSDQYIGWCGVSHSIFLDHIELSYRYCSDSWGEGYAFEAADAIISETYEVSDINDILACVHPDNKASIRILEKLGFNYSFSTMSKPVGIEIPVYKIDRETYTRKQQPR